MIRYAIALALTLAAGNAHAGELYWQRNDPEKEWKHITTGAAIGAGTMGICVEVSRRVASLDTIGCYVFTVGATFGGYWLKERRDQRMYGHGKYLDARDIAEGVGGAAVGAGILIPIAGI